MSTEFGLFIIILMILFFDLSVSLSFKTLEKQLNAILAAIKISTDILDKNEQIINLLLTDYVSKERTKLK